MVSDPRATSQCVITTWDNKGFAGEVPAAGGAGDRVPETLSGLEATESVPGQVTCELREEGKQEPPRPCQGGRVQRELRGGQSGWNRAKQGEVKPGKEGWE